MNAQKIKLILFFIVSTVVFFYAGHRFARQAEANLAADWEQSVSFLEVVNNLSTIQFDFDFIDSLGNTDFLTGAYVPRAVRPLNIGRDNPFRKFDQSSVQSVNFGGTTSNFEGFIDRSSRSTEGDSPGDSPSSEFTDVDVTGPHTPIFSPGHNAIVTADTTVTVAFGETVYRQDGATPVSISHFVGPDSIFSLYIVTQDGNNSRISGYIVDHTDNTFIVDPNEDLLPGRSYVAAVTGNYYDGDGNRGAAASVTFSVDADESESSASVSGVRVTR